MPRVRLTGKQWTEKASRGLAAIVRGQRMTVVRSQATGQPARVAVELVDDDPQCAVIDGRLDAEDLARMLTGFRGQPLPVTPAMRYVRTDADGQGSAYVIDAESGMVYLLD
jgi:hypothetical protein